MSDASPLARALAMGGTEESRARRADGDFFPTPPDVTEALLRAEPWFKEPRNIWEPHCGEGHLVKQLMSVGHEVYGTERSDRGFGITGVDFLTAPLPEGIDTIVMNPPFANAGDHIRQALSHGLQFVATVIQNEFWARKKHLAIFRTTPPSRVYPCAWKPDFTGAGSGIFCVQWCIWDVSHEGPTAFQPLERPRECKTAEMFA